MVGQLHLAPHQAFDQVFAQQKLADQKRCAHQPIQHRGFPFNKVFILGQQRGTPKQHDHPQADPLHGFDLAQFKAQVGNLDDGGDDGHRCGGVDAPEFEYRKKQGNREKINQ